MKNGLFPSKMIESGEEEKKRFYRAGRMSTLFELVDDSKLSFEQVCDFLSWQIEDVYDMYQGYRESRNLQKE